jgi:hypothetical protein
MPEGPQARVITLRDASRSLGVGPPALRCGCLAGVGECGRRFRAGVCFCAPERAGAWVGSSSFGIGTRVERRGHDRLTAGLRLTGAECPTLPAPPVRRVARERAGGKSGPGLRVSMSQQSAGTLRGRGDSPRCQCSDIGGNCGSGFHGGAPFNWAAPRRSPFAWPKLLATRLTRKFSAWRL